MRRGERDSNCEALLSVKVKKRYISAVHLPFIIDPDVGVKSPTALEMRGSLLVNEGNHLQRTCILFFIKEYMFASVPFTEVG